MNPQTHSVIFNKTRGCLMAVGENAQSSGSGGCSGARRMRRASGVAVPHMPSGGASTQKRMGDGFYEQKLIREQVLALTGNRFLGDYRSDDTLAL